jgi:hypothetical protein
MDQRGMLSDSEIRTEIERLGGDDFRRRVESASSQALSGSGAVQPSPELNAVRREYMEQVQRLLEEGQRFSRLSDTDVSRLVCEIQWAVLTSHAIIHLPVNGGGGGTGLGCAAQCEKDYNDCMRTLSCTRTSWLCLCCMPCSIQYLGCMVKCGKGGIA